MTEQVSQQAAKGIPLPGGWEQHHSKKFNRPYFYHLESGKSVWVHPSLLNKNEIKKINGQNVQKEETKSKDKVKTNTFGSQVNDNKPAKTPIKSPPVKQSSSNKVELPTKKNKLSVKEVNKANSTLKPIHKKKATDKAKQQIKKQITNISEISSRAQTSEISQSKLNVEDVLNTINKTSEVRYAPYKKELSVLKPMKGKKNQVKPLPKTPKNLSSLPKIPKRIRTLSDSSSVKSNDSHTPASNNPFLNSLSKNKAKSAETSLHIPKKVKDRKNSSLQRSQSLSSEGSVQSIHNENLQSNQSSVFQQTTTRRHSNESIPNTNKNFVTQNNHNHQIQPNTFPQTTNSVQFEQEEDMKIDDNFNEQQHQVLQQDFIINQQMHQQTDSMSQGNHDAEEDMEIDDAVEMNRDILREIRGMREEKVISRPEIPTDIQPNENLPSYTDPLYIVVDTNILLGHMKFVSELKDYPIPGIGAPILVIPWMVFQELDSLKDQKNRFHHTNVNESGDQEKSQRLSVLARQAIKFISNCLNISHPRVKGQSVIEAGTKVDGFTEENNDDSILHCCLLLKARAAHSHVVLLSNDRNLCNKAIITGIKAFQQKTLLMDLRSLFQHAAVAIRRNHQEYDEQARLEEIMAQRRKQADDLSIELQCILREGFAVIIETEMKEAYGDDLWLSIVKIQPPWTLSDVLTLLEKHWIAVFGMIVKRSMLETVQLLKLKFHATQGLAGCLEISKELIELSLKLFESFLPRSNYGDMLPRCLAGVKVLLKQCDEYIALATPVNGLPPTAPMHALPPSNQPQQPQNKEEPPQQTANNEQAKVSPYEQVIQTFSAIWRTVNHFSALIFYSLDFPSALTKDLDKNEKMPSPQQSLECLLTMTPCLFQLISMLQKVIHVPEEELPQKSQTIIDLLRSIQQFMKLVMKQDCNIQPLDLLQFCQQSKSQLVQGLSRLDRSYATLQQCVEFHQAVR